MAPRSTPTAHSQGYPDQNMINAGFHAGRKALEDYSEFDSSMVPDDALMTFVNEVLNAACRVMPVPTAGGPTTAPGSAEPAPPPIDF